jgi:hypothetical protein
MAAPDQLAERQSLLTPRAPFSNRSDKRKRKNGDWAHDLSLASLQVISLVRPRRRLSLAPTAGSRRRRAQVVSRLAASSAAAKGLALIRPSTTARWLDRGPPFFLLFLGSHSVGPAASSGSRFSPQSAAPLQHLVRSTGAARSTASSHAGAAQRPPPQSSAPSPRRATNGSTCDAGSQLMPRLECLPRGRARLSARRHGE